MHLGWILHSPADGVQLLLFLDAVVRLLHALGHTVPEADEALRKTLVDCAALPTSNIHRLLRQYCKRGKRKTLKGFCLLIPWTKDATE